MNWGDWKCVQNNSAKNHAAWGSAADGWKNHLY